VLILSSMRFFLPKASKPIQALATAEWPFRAASGAMNSKELQELTDQLVRTAGIAVAISTTIVDVDVDWLYSSNEVLEARIRPSEKTSGLRYWPQTEGILFHGTSALQIH
jgi:hypothetical protein